MVCLKEEIVNMSTYCLKESVNSSLCGPEIHPAGLRQVAGVWCIINAIVGFSGNLLTLLAIPYASKHKRYSLHRNWNTTTIFILNLAAADWLYCAINLPLYAKQYLTSDGTGISEILCYISTAFRYVNAFADWMSLGMIAVSRCIALIFPTLSDTLSTGPNGKTAILCIWLYANILLVPVYAESTFKMGTFGYNCRLGKCDFIPSTVSQTPQIVFYGIGFTVPGILTSASYLCIWAYVRSSSTYLRRNHDENRRQVNTRDLKMTWTILMICLCYFIFVMPITILNMIDPYATRPELHLIAFCLYWMQYSLNFIVYAARSKPYRQAYGYFLNQMKHEIIRFFCGVTTSTTTTSSHIYFIDRSIPAHPKGFCHCEQKFHLPPRPTSPNISAHPGQLEEHETTAVQATIKTISDQPSVIIMTKTKHKKLWLKTTSSLNEGEDTDSSDSSSIKLRWIRDDQKGHAVCLVIKSPDEGLPSFLINSSKRLTKRKPPKITTIRRESV